MAINTDYDSDLAEMIPEVTKMRTVIKGSYFVKRGGETYLRNPNQVDATSTTAIKNYDAYKDGAEFDDYTLQTQQSMIGKMALDKFEPEMPKGLEFLLNDVDGDGLSLKGLTESCAKNVLEVKWHIAVVDFMGLHGIPASEVSITDNVKARPVIKQYSRESVVKYDFAVVNGAYQLSFIMFKEIEYVLNQSTYEKDKVESFTILALDDDGNYYQQKVITENESSKAPTEGERFPVTVKGKPLKFIPLEVVSDEELSCELPQSMGFLNKIANVCLSRYRVSAEYKLALSKFVPTMVVYGLDDNDLEIFNKVNGRSYFAVGQTNIMPKESNRVEMLSVSGSLADFRQYMIDSKDKIKTLGGVIPEFSSGETSATEAMINASEQNAVLTPLVNSIERSIKNLISYCAMFQGLVDQEKVSEYAKSIDFDMPQDFAKISPDTEAGRFILEMVNNRVMTKEQAVKRLLSLGWHEGVADEILMDIENIEPDITPV